MEQLRPVLLSLLAGRGVMVLDVRARPLLVRSSPTEIEQLVLNLVMNARDSVAEGGEIRIRRSSRSSAELSDDESSAVLEVRDDGEGMDEATRAHLFEPAAVYGIVQRGRGSVEAESERGKGIRVRVTFPQIAADCA